MKIDPENLRPMNGYVLLHLDGGRTTGGLYVPDQAKDKHQKRKAALVVAVSEGEWTQEGKLLEPRVRVGERVFLTSSAQVEQNADMEDYAFAHQRDVLCVVSDARGN